MAMLERRSDVTEADAGRVDRLVARLAGRSRLETRGLFDHGCVTLNGQPCAEPGRVVSPGESVRVRFDPHRRYHPIKAPRTDGSFRIVFEDEHLLVVDKSARLLTVPSERVKEKSLVDAVSQYLSQGKSKARAWVVHRLDKGVSGLVVLAKHAAAAGRLQDEIRSRRMSREYVAVVAGRVEPAEGTFDSVLTTDRFLNRRSRPAQRVEFDFEDDTDGPEADDSADAGQRAVTHYKVVRAGKGFTVVGIRLETGRRHQIRVQFAEAGHPVLGDRRYREDLAYHPAWFGRIALHAERLSFTHPVTGKPMSFHAPPPSEFERFLR